MRIAIAQTHPIPGALTANRDQHLRLANLAALENADWIIFPELSLSGYEPELTASLAMTPEDPLLQPLQALVNKTQLKMILGIPLSYKDGVSIASLILRPNQAPQVQGKQFLHADEVPYFLPYENERVLIDEADNIALAICYELSVDAHVEAAAQAGAKYYLASVAKHEAGVGQAWKRLAEIKDRYSLHVMMANCTGEGESGKMICAGRSGISADSGMESEQVGIALWESTRDPSEIRIHLL